MLVRVTEFSLGLHTAPELYFRHPSGLLGFGPAGQSKTQLLRMHILGVFPPDSLFLC